MGETYNSGLAPIDPKTEIDSIVLRLQKAFSGSILLGHPVIRVLFAIFVLLIGAFWVWNVVREDKYAPTTLYVSERSLNNVIECISSNSTQIRSDLQPISKCRWGSAGRTPCQPGMTSLSADGQMRLSVQPSDGTVEIRIRHNQPLSSTAIETLERCAR